MGLTVLGSKSIGLSIAQEVRRIEPDARILTFDDREDSRSRHDDLTALGARVLADPKHPDVGDAALVIVAGWYWLLGREALEDRRVVGIHNSLLPRYRGGSPLVWAMIRGDRQVGVSLFELVSGMDAGPIWGQTRLEVGPDEMVGNVLPRLEAAAIDLLRDALPTLRDPAAAGTPQDDDAATFCAQRASADGRIDWSWSAQRIHDFVRAQSRPYPGAFTECQGRRITIWETRLIDQTYFGSPGQIIAGGVICGDARPIQVLDSSVALPRSGRLGQAGWFSPVP